MIKESEKNNKTLNLQIRRKNLFEITKNNEKIHLRLKKIKGKINNKKLSEQNVKTRKLLRNISRFPKSLLKVNN